MKSSDTIPVAVATAPNWILNVEPEPVGLEFQSNLEKDDEGFPKRSTVQPMDFYFGYTGYKNNWKTVEIVSVIQSVLVVFMIATQWSANEYPCGNEKSNDFICHYWICVMFMEIASVSNIVVTTYGFRKTCCIATVIAFQCSAFVVWIIFLILGSITFVSKPEDADVPVAMYERAIIWLSLIISFFAALAAFFCAKMLWSVLGELDVKRRERELEENLEVWNKFCTLLSNRYDDIALEIDNPVQMSEREEYGPIGDDVL